MITRPQLALATLTLITGAVIGALVVFVVMNTDNDDEPDPPGLSRDLTAAAGEPTATTIPDPVLMPASTVMFCVPVVLAGDPRAIGLAPAGTTARYRRGTCEPMLGIGESISVTRADGIVEALPFERAANADDLERIVWSAAAGVANGEPTVLTGRFILDARIDDDEFGASVVVVEFQQEGPDLLRQVTRENVGLPLTLWINGEPLRLDDGSMWHVVITEETGGPIVIEGLATGADIVVQDQLNALLTDE